VQQLTGRTTEEFAAKPVSLRQIVHPAWLEQFDTYWDSATNGRVPQSFEYQILHKNGETRWILQRAVLVRDSAGNAVALEGIATDTSDLKAKERELKRNADQLKKERDRLEKKTVALTEILGHLETAKNSKSGPSGSCRPPAGHRECASG
jgi:PAS domain S-box-containing protein